MLLKTTKRYTISTDAVNRYGFRALTTGIDISDYVNNPVMLFMHKRAYADKKEEVWLPVGCIKELQFEADGTLTGQPYFKDTDDFAKQLYNDYEDGVLNMLSAGLEPVEISEAPEDMVQGQTGPTLTKTKLVEVSCADIGANPEAFAVALYDANKNLIELSAPDALTKLFQTTQTNANDNMKLVTLGAGPVAIMLAALKLDPEKATENDVAAKVNELVTLSATQATQITTITSDRDTLKTKYDDLVKLSDETKVTDLVQKAIDERKILPGQKEHFVKLASGDFENTKAVLDSMTGSAPVNERLSGDGKTDERAELAKLSLDELHESGKLELVKLSYRDLYEQKFEAQFGVKPKA